MTALRHSTGRRWGQWEDRSHLCKHHTNKSVTRAYLNRFFSVQIGTEQTEWGAVLHLYIKRHDESTHITWADKQRIKNELVGPERVAIEVFPCESDLVNDAHMFHLWVLPAGMDLPFRLS